MEVIYSLKFLESFKKFPKEIDKKFKKQIEYLLRDYHHPSLNAKKYNKSENIWQARVNKNIRFYFQIKGDRYILIGIKRHPK